MGFLTPLAGQKGFGPRHSQKEVPVGADAGDGVAKVEFLVGLIEGEVGTFAKETGEGKNNDSSSGKVVEHAFELLVFTGVEPAVRAIPEIGRAPALAASGNVAV